MSDAAAASLRVRVARKVVEATDVCSFELRPVEGRTLPPFSAGAHIDVHVGQVLSRPYSLCNDPAETHRYLIAVLLDAKTRGGSKAMHALREGDVVSISVPRNHFALAEHAGHSLLLAGGIGVTPMLAMAEQLARLGADFVMHYCTRSAARTAFAERIAAAPYAPRVRIHRDDGDAAQRLDLAALLAGPRPDGHLYVCGPAGFIDAVLGAARAAGWPQDRLHAESFSAGAAVADGDTGFELRLARSGRVIEVRRDQTAVQALAEAGVEVPTSCEQGVCGTCLTRVLDGQPDHRDMVLTPAEQAANTLFLPCCSRARSRTLVLDL